MLDRIASDSLLVYEPGSGWSWSMISDTDSMTQLGEASKKTDKMNLDHVEEESVAVVSVRTECHIALARIWGRKYRCLRLCFRIILRTCPPPRKEAGLRAALEQRRQGHGQEVQPRLIIFNEYKSV